MNPEPGSFTPKWLRNRGVWMALACSFLLPPPEGQARQRVLREELRAEGAAEFGVERSYAYHPAGVAGAGRVSQVTHANTGTTLYAYDLGGRQTFVSGTAAYPVRYEYDAFGDLWKMHTHRSGSPTAESTGDVTEWVRDAA